MTTLAEVIDFIEDPNAFDVLYDGHKVSFQDEYGLSCGSNGEWFVAGEEYGAEVLIHARSYGDAWEAWIDERPTISEDEVPEAYGVDDSEEMKAWREAHPINTWSGPEYEVWSTAKLTEAKRILASWGDAARNEERDYPRANRRL